MSFDNRKTTPSGDTLPIVDTTAVVKGSGDATKLVRIEADGLTTGTTRVITMPDEDIALISASSTETFTNKTFDANGTGNSLSNVDVADLANGTDGELITWDSAGAPTTVSVGTSGQLLTSNGAGAEPTFQAAPAGGEWTLVSSTTITAKSNSTEQISVTDASDTEFKAVYRFDLNSGTSNLAGRFNGDTDSNYADKRITATGFAKQSSVSSFRICAIDVRKGVFGEFTFGSYGTIFLVGQSVCSADGDATMVNAELNAGVSSITSIDFVFPSSGEAYTGAIEVYSRVIS